MKQKLLLILIVWVATFVVIVGCSITPTSTPKTAATPTEQNTGPWPGVSVYRDSNSPIVTRVNETFSIVLPPTPLFGWGWQNQDLSAFALLETKTVPGLDNETNPFGPNAFLFKALKIGTYQITLYVPSKPPQYLESFDIVVNP